MGGKEYPLKPILNQTGFEFSTQQEIVEIITELKSMIPSFIIERLTEYCNDIFGEGSDIPHRAREGLRDLLERTVVQLTVEQRERLRFKFVHNNKWP